MERERERERERAVFLWRWVKERRGSFPVSFSFSENKRLGKWLR
jgi:hypothetical protein